MGLAENNRLIESFFEAGNRGDPDRCLELLDEHVKWINIGSTTFSGTFMGEEALVRDLLDPVLGKLESGIRPTIENIVSENDFMVVPSRGHAETACSSGSSSSPEAAE